MKLRNKISIIILLASFILIITVYISSQFIMKKSYLALENESAVNNMLRLTDAIDQMETSVSSVLGSWAIWDDTYNFMSNRNEAYIKSNLQISSFTSSDIDLILYFNPQGQLFYSIAADVLHTKAVPLPANLLTYLSPQSKLVRQANVDSGMQGLILLPSGLLMVSAHSIVSSKGSGPVHGTLIMGRFFTNSSLAKLKFLTKVDVSLFTLPQIKQDPQLSSTYHELQSTPYIFNTVNDQTLIGYVLLKDFNDTPIAMLKANLPRKIYQVGLETINYYNSLAIASSLILIFLLWASLQTLVVKRMEKLLKKITNTELNTDTLPALTPNILDEVTIFAQLYQHATHDQLTGLGNRHLIYQGFQNRVASLPAGKKIVIIFIDLDNFKFVNDTLGHEVGDEYLILLAKQLKSLLKNGDVAARLGGDEFVLMLFDVDSQSVDSVVKKLFAAIKREVVIQGHTLDIACTMGVSIYPDHGNSIPILLKHADIALYHGKEAGRNQYQYYSNDLSLAIQEANKKEWELQRAIDNKELFLVYQPIYDTFSRNIIVVEALIRWKHPQRGLLPASEIIPLAEKTGLIVPIGKWVLKTACAQMKAWHDRGMPKIPIAVNLSLLQIKSMSINTLISDALIETGLEPRFLELELTETSYIEINETILNDLQTLKARGVRLAVDDFGVGYSGLGYLKSLPISKLKIDQSFIRDIQSDKDDRAIVLAIIAIAHQLNLIVVAEGVETNEQCEFLKNNYVDAIQGNFLCAPIDAASYEKLIETLLSVS